MNLKKLNARGFTHVAVLAVVVVAVAAVGTWALVTSHADTKSTSSTGWTLVGQVSLPQQNQTITAYGCETDLSSTTRQVEGQFTVGTYKNPNGFAWSGTIFNASSDPLKGYQTVTGVIPDTAFPSAILTTEVDGSDNGVAITNPLTFSYSAGIPGQTPTVSGNIATKVYPSHFVACANSSS